MLLVDLDTRAAAAAAAAAVAAVAAVAAAESLVAFISAPAALRHRLSWRG